MLERKGKIVINSIEEMIDLARVLPEKFKFKLNASAYSEAMMKQGQMFFDEEGVDAIDLRDRIIDVPKIKNIYLIIQE